MLLLEQRPPGEQTWFADHLDQRVRHVLAPGVVVRRDPDGSPRFAFVRYRGEAGTGSPGGALLHLELATAAVPSAVLEQAEASAATVVRVPFVRSRFRLVRWLADVPGEQPLGPWQVTTPGGGTLVGSTLHLEPDAATVLAEAIEHDAGAAVAVEAVFRGLVRGLPTVAVVDRARLDAHLLATVGEGPVTADHVVAAFLSLPSGEGVVTFRPVADAPQASRETALAALAHGAIAELFTLADTDPWDRSRLRYVRGTAPAEWTRDLSPLRAEDRSWTASWSIGDLLAELSPEQRARAYPSLPPLSPFVRVDVLVTCGVPVDGDAVRAVDVTLRTTGPGGVHEFHTLRFEGSQAAGRITAFSPASTGPLDLAVRVVTTLGPDPAGPPWPRVLTVPFRATPGPAVDVTAADTTAEVVRVEAESGVFTRASAVDVVLLRDGRTVARRTLTADRPSAVLAAPAPPPAQPAPSQVSAEAVERTTTGTARRAVVLEFPLQGDTGPDVVVPAHAVEVLSPDQVTVTLFPGAQETSAAVAITVEDGSGRSRTASLEPGTSTDLPCWRPTVFDPLAYRYQVLRVPVRPDGTTAPLVHGPWIAASATTLLLTAALLPNDEN